MIEPAELPISVRRNGDLFEIVFAFLVVPVLVVSMDHPPFYLGGKILLWMGSLLLLRRLPKASRDRVFGQLQALRRPLVLLGLLIGLAITGAVLALYSGLFRFQAIDPAQRWISGAVVLPAFAMVVSFPVSVLGWIYLPLRFENSTWFPVWIRNLLPILGFAALHLASGGWAAPILALAAGGIYWWAFKGRVPLIPAILVHAVVGWMGIVGGIW